MCTSHLPRRLVNARIPTDIADPFRSLDVWKCSAGTGLPNPVCPLVSAPCNRDRAEARIRNSRCLWAGSLFLSRVASSGVLDECTSILKPQCSGGVR